VQKECIYNAVITVWGQLREMQCRSTIMSQLQRGIDMNE